MKLIISDIQAERLAEQNILLLCKNIIRERHIQQMCNQIIEKLDEEETDLTLVISSKGSDFIASSGFADFVRLLHKDVKITGIAMGDCSSGALGILQSCTIRSSLPHCWFLIHSSRTEIEIKAAGNQKRLLDNEQRDLIETDRILENIHCERSGLSRAKWRKLVRDGDLSGRTLSAEELLELNLLDNITDSFRVLK